MNKFLSAGVVCIVLLVAGCAQKDISVSDSGASEQESIQDNVAIPSAPPLESSVKAMEFASGSVLSGIYFDFDKFNIRPDMQSVVDESAQKIREISGMNVLVEGNTDEFGSDEYNYALGVKRALSVKNALVVKGIVKDEIKVVSFGKSKPICEEQAKDCYQKNRRADIKVVK